MHHADLTSLPVAVLGAGPVGLAAAAHLLARGLTPLVLEAGSGVGANLASYRHVRLFSPWRYNMDKAALRLLGPPPPLAGPRRGPPCPPSRAGCAWPTA